MKVNQRGEKVYYSFQELASAYNVKPVKNSEKVEKKKDEFLKRFKCKSCGEPLTYVEGTTVMVCKNPKCKGIKISNTDKDGNEIVSYMTSYSLLGNGARNIAEKIFKEKKEQ